MRRALPALAILPTVAILALGGVGVNAQSTLRADGVIESTSGGFRFPDGSVQVTAWNGYAGVVVVAEGGGDFTSIQQALDSITDAAADRRYLVRVGPGVYPEQVTMKAFVDLEGAGRDLTRIESPSSPALSCDDDAEVRSLTVATSSSFTVVACVNDVTRLSDLSVRMEGSACTGVDASFGAVTLRSVEIHEATTCETARAFLSDFGSPVSEDLTITMRGTGLVRVGIRCDSGSCSFRNTRIDIAGASLGQGVGVEDGSATFHDLTIRLDELAQRAEGILTVGGTGIGEVRVSEARIVTGPDVGDAYGVHLFADGDTRIERSSIEVRGSGTGFGYGVHLSDPGPVLLSGLEIGVEGHDENVGLRVVSNDLEARGLGIVSTGGTSAIGIETRSSSGSYDVEIDGSSIRADHQTVQGDAEFAVSIGGSRLAGGAVDAGGGSITCAGVWDESSVFYPDTCP